jgi:acyl-CoA synthetase (AMP-forming)/AMP-acid ligase II
VSLAAILRAHAQRDPAATAFVFLERLEREAGRTSYAELDLRARAIAAELQARGCQGERVLVALPTGPEFVAAFFGCLYAGAVAVPAPEPEIRRSVERAIAICDDCKPRLALTAGAARRISPAWRQWREAGGLAELAVQDIADEAAERWRDTGVGEQALALLQYTSGSTRAPRGVMVTHAALLANIRMLIAADQMEPDSRVVSWLPIYHDMGLVMGVLAPVCAGVQSVLMPPPSFLQQPLRWPQVVARYRGTVSGGPSFAFDLCAQAAERQVLPAIDLSCWKVAFCGAEPIRRESLEHFARAFEPHGFRRAALRPAYGLAEATLFVSGGRSSEGIASARHPGTGRELASCGWPAQDQHVVIADPDSLVPLAEGEVGEVLVSGANVAAGYWNRSAESEATFRCRVRGDDARTYLRTGDLGFLQGGRLAIVGRAKDLIVIRGENHHPEDIEASVAGTHPALASGAGAAFSIDGDAGEELVVVFELERAAAPSAAEIGRAVTARITERHGLAVRELAFIRPLALPRTANGKVQRARCRERYLAGDLSWVARVSGARRVA